ncbi:hypothetical protein B0F90DRAFT_1825236 [Multifurca ochricompacta]|uniref:Uncharacterized protein n=1 Tax=Multifurca ochricompacta TaxID=376703 RepID=A0AAD4LUU5_9AGAM|nr:hypothetical protein B0F90DRAFT_1825236 [Multifurca ochricompacta]
MSVFNPKILDASIRDVVAALSNDDKISVLLYAIERLPTCAETVIENGVQSCLHFSSTHQNKVIQARLLRAKARFAAGLRGAAHQDLQAILLLDPSHREARELLPPPGGKISQGVGHVRLAILRFRGYMNSNLTFLVKCRMPGLPRFSNEIWREIASFLPRRDLRSLLLLPHVLSSIASQLLFKNVCLQFGTGHSDTRYSEAAAEIDKWHAQRSADILIRLVSDTAYASLVRSLIVWAPEKRKNALASFQTAMLANVLPKLTNLKGLVIAPTGSSPSPLPALHSLNHFVYSGSGDSALVNVDGFLSTQTVALHTLIIHHFQRCPASFLPTSTLRNLYLTFSISNADFLSQLLANGHQLESLRLEIDLGHDCVLSTVFRAHAKPNSFPAMRKLAFVLTSAAHDLVDPDLFPAVSEFVRGYHMLDALCISNTYGLTGFGYDAAIWGVLPSLVNLRTLLIDVPKDMPSALSAWLIPRSVTVLDLQVIRHATLDLDQLSPGLPGGLKFLALPFHPSEIQGLIQNGLSELRLVRLVGDAFYTIHATNSEKELEHWPSRRERFYFDDYLEQLDCEELRFLYPRLSWAW